MSCVLQIAVFHKGKKMNLKYKKNTRSVYQVKFRNWIYPEEIQPAVCLEIHGQWEYIQFEYYPWLSSLF